MDKGSKLVIVFMVVLTIVTVVGVVAILSDSQRERGECRDLFKSLPQYEEIFVRTNYCLGSDVNGVVYNLKALEE